MGTYKILSKNESTTVLDGETWAIPNDGLDIWNQYALTIYVNGAGNHPAMIINPDSEAEATGMYIPGNGTLTLSPLKTKDFPSILASHGDIDVHVSYSMISYR